MDVFEQRFETPLPAATFGVTRLDGDSGGYLTASMDGRVHHIDSNGDHVKELHQGHRSYASRVVSIPESNWAISSGFDGRLVWYDLATSREIRTVEAHRFWSWDLKRNIRGDKVASATGQYRTGGYRYEPAPLDEPGIKVFDVANGALAMALETPAPALSLAWSSDDQYLAAATLMGDCLVWRMRDGEKVAHWRDDTFTSWGIIKSHHYIGGIFDLTFAEDDELLIACGMGQMRDPMAGNGKQTWRAYRWRENSPTPTREIDDKDQGRGLMEALALSPDGSRFLMAGRLAQGSWNVALFDTATGKLLGSMDNGTRVTGAQFSNDGSHVTLSGAKSQGKKQEDGWRAFGRLQEYRINA